EAFASAIAGLAGSDGSLGLVLGSAGLDDTVSFLTTSAFAKPFVSAEFGAFEPPAANMKKNSAETSTPPASPAPTIQPGTPFGPGTAAPGSPSGKPSSIIVRGRPELGGWASVLMTSQGAASGDCSTTVRAGTSANGIVSFIVAAGLWNPGATSLTVPAGRLD